MGNLIGGTNPGEGNVIAGNGGIGVAINSWYGNAVRGNSIYANGGLGIDLGSDGPDANDTGDTDTGPNNRQNRRSSTASPERWQQPDHGEVQQPRAAPYALEFFASASCDPTGFGEGQDFLGSVSTPPASAATGLSPPPCPPCPMATS